MEKSPRQKGRDDVDLQIQRDYSHYHYQVHKPPYKLSTTHKYSHKIYINRIGRPCHHLLLAGSPQRAASVAGIFLSRRIFSNWPHSMLHVLAFISSIADAKTSSLPTVIVSFWNTCPWDNWKWFLVLILTLKSSIYNRDHPKTTLTWPLSYNTNRMGKIIMHSSIFTLNTPHSLDVMVMPACTKYAEKGEEVRAS